MRSVVLTKAMGEFLGVQQMQELFLRCCPQTFVILNIFQ